MKQILQNLGNGETMLADVPCPHRGSGQVLIQTTNSLVSLGTEKMLVDFGRGSYLAKARSQPDKVKQVLQKIKTDGLWTTIDAVRAKLDQPITLGYCNVGQVLEAPNHSEFSAGDRVISNGPHAEVVSVSQNLVARIPDEVSDQDAAYTVVAAIGLQGIRLAQPTLGERIVVSGLGLIGLLTVQMLRAQGCQVLGIDYDQQKLELAKSFGALTVDLSQGEDPVRAAEHWTDGAGVDAVIITASTKSDELVHQAATMCRKRGRIILVGVIGLNLRRADFYEKELSFQVSCSYGPGRYDANYEARGLDYPIGFVRWTEKRNFEAVLQLIREGRIETDSLTTHRVEFDQALRAYEAIHEPGAMGILLSYPQGERPELRDRTLEANSDGSEVSSNACPSIGFIGAGAFTTRMLLPKLPTDGIVRDIIVSGAGVTSAQAAKKFSFKRCGTDSGEVISSVDVVFITTPHHTHASLVCQSLSAGRHTFVEKPLAMNLEELKRIEESAASRPECILMVGFNRRFSPHTRAVKGWLSATPASKAIIITVNAGMIPAEHWTQDPETGGGRIIGEACHFIDLARCLVGHSIQRTTATAMCGGDGKLGDCASIQLGFADGSIATIHYLANGSKSFPKERIEVFAGGRVAVIDNFRRSYIVGERISLKTRLQDKGHTDEIEAFLKSVKGSGPRPISTQELSEVSRSTIEANELIRAELAKAAD